MPTAKKPPSTGKVPAKGPRREHQDGKVVTVPAPPPAAMPTGKVWMQDAPGTASSGANTSANVTVTTGSTAPTPAVSPAVRVIRTMFQVALAILAAVPIAVGALGLSAATAAKAVGIAGAIVVIVTALQNGLEKAGAIPTVTATPKAPGG